MKKLNDILKNVEILDLKGTLDHTVSSLAFDSRTVESNSLFVAVQGTQVDGHQFIAKAIEAGATTIVCQELPNQLNEHVCYVRVKSSPSALGVMASNFYDSPSSKLKLVGITGTNGKTTTATLLYNLFTQLGYKTGLLSTILNKIHLRALPASHTTPDALQLNKILSDMVNDGCDFAFMEVSSHAIEQDRVAGISFAGAVFTNITHDHLDYHLTFRNYLSAKKRLFDHLPKTAFALSNGDDKNGKVMLQNTPASKYLYGLKNMADFKCRVIENHFSGMQLEMDGSEVHTVLSGDFNAYNMLAVYATAILLKQNKEEVLPILSRLKGAEGRFDLIRSKENITAIVDYAHTPDALKNVLETINSLRTQNEQLITVVGAGGDRDREKRPLMAKIASTLSNRVILTSDNPRSEDPNAILGEMQKGIDQSKMRTTLIIPDRKEAIKTAINLAAPNDIILVAGKGHEKYQEIKGVRYPFDDKQILTELLEM